MSGQTAVKADLPSVNPAFLVGDSRLEPDAAGERRHDVGESGMAVQQDLGPDFPRCARQHDAGTFAAGRGGTKCQPGLGGVVRNQTRNGCGHTISERSFADERANEFLSRRLEHELQFRKPRKKGHAHSSLAPRAGSLVAEASNNKWVIPGCPRPLRRQRPQPYQFLQIHAPISGLDGSPMGSMPFQVTNYCCIFSTPDAPPSPWESPTRARARSSGYPKYFSISRSSSVN